MEYHIEGGLRRSKRSTAGNRMEEALLQFATEDQNLEMEEDAEFESLEDEVEIFDSDFQSTDEEDLLQDEGEREKTIIEEEKRHNRLLRQRASKVTASIITRRGAKGQKQTPKIICRKVSLGVAADAEIGEAMNLREKRKSGRRSTILASQSLSDRLKDAEVKRAALPKRAKEVSQVLSQAELIARALDNEESNLDEHRNYLAQEEEKRKRARTVRKSVSGPLMRWVSRVEQEKVIDSHHQASVGYPHAECSDTANSMKSQEMSCTSFTPPALHSLCPDERLASASKSYVVIEKDQKEGASMPQWNETMTCLFGNHVKWDQVKILTGKNRPLTRPIAKCPLTGRTASYRDPRSGVPFANVRAYKTLTRILNHEYDWHSESGCYVVDSTYIATSENV